MKRTVKLRESELKKMIAESVSKVVNEMNTMYDEPSSEEFRCEYTSYIMKRFYKQVANLMSFMRNKPHTIISSISEEKYTKLFNILGDISFEQ